MKVTSSLSKYVPRDLAANLRWRAMVHRAVMDKPMLADVLRDACAVDPIFWVNGFCYTYDPRIESFSKVPFILYDFQEDAVLRILRAIPRHDVLIEKSRDMGASWICAVSFTYGFQFTDDKTFLFLSSKKENVDSPGNPKTLFWKMDYLIEHQPVWLQPRGYKRSEHSRSLHRENPETGTVVDGEATISDVARGDRRTAILLDEFAKFDHGYEAMAATRDAANCRIFNSTPRGVNNAFADKAHDPAIEKIRIHWSLHPDKAKGLYNKENGQYNAIDASYWSTISDTTTEMERLDTMILTRGIPLPDKKLRSPWYAIQCERAISAQEVAQELDIDYLGSGHQYFNQESITETIRKYARPAILIGNLEYDHHTGDPIRFRTCEGGRLYLWFTMDKTGACPISHRIVLGCDISAGTGASNSTACGWDAVTCEKLLEYVNPHIRPEEFAKQVKALAKWLNDAHVIWESNGVGSQFGARLTELGYGNVYYRSKDRAISGQVSNLPGWPSNPDAKLVVLGQYRDIIETGECLNYSKEALEEALAYIHTPDGSVAHSKALSKADPSGARKNHGDRVMADALAVRCFYINRLEKEQEKPDIPVGCLAWRNQQREAKKTTIGCGLPRDWAK